MAAVAAMMMLYPTIRRMPRQSQKVRHLWQDATFITISPMACESPRCVDREHTTITATETNTNSIIIKNGYATVMVRGVSLMKLFEQD